MILLGGIRSFLQQFSELRLRRSRFHWEARLSPSSYYWGEVALRVAIGAFLLVHFSDDTAAPLVSAASREGRTPPSPTHISGDMRGRLVSMLY